MAWMAKEPLINKPKRADGDDRPYKKVDGEWVPIDLPDTVGAIITHYRKKKGLNRTSLARLIGVSANSLAKYERAGEKGGRYPSSEHAAKICEAIDLDPRTFFTMFVYEGKLKPTNKNFHTFNSWFAERKEEYELQNIYAKLNFYEYDLGNIFSKLEAIERVISKFSDVIENGSNQIDSSRPETSDHPKTVGAVIEKSISKSKEEIPNE